MKILSVVGARPNFMKVAPLIREWKRFSEVEHFLVHSGQHYDNQLSDAFFRDLDMPQPDVNLQVGSGSHAVQTAEVMKRLEPVLLEQSPDLVVVVGDVNSTMAAAIDCAKLGIPLAHVEAGLRSFDNTMPEEINRRLTDAVADFLFVSEESGVLNLRAEGVGEDKIFLVGNVMIDSLLRCRKAAAHSDILRQLNVAAEGEAAPYAVLTLHRPSNVDDPAVMLRVLEPLAELAREVPVFFPVHPRTQERMRSFGFARFLATAQNGKPSGITPLEPLGYLDFLCLMDHATLVLTDSGGIQEETTALGVPCITLRENTERPATVECGTNRVVGLDPDRILSSARQALSGEFPKGRRPQLWDGRAAERIVRIALERLRPELVESAASRQGA